MSMHTCLQTCLQELPQIHKCKYTNTYTYTHTPIYRNITTYKYTQTQALKHTNIHMLTYAHTYTNIHLHKFIHQSAMNMLIIPYTWFDKGQYASSNEHNLVCTNKSATLTYIKITAYLCLSLPLSLPSSLPSSLLRALYPSVFLSLSVFFLFLHHFV